MSRIYSPSPSVRSDRVPYYMRGVGLGDDFTFEDSSPIIPESIDVPYQMMAPPPPDLGPISVPAFSSPGFFSPVNPDLQPLIAQGFSPDTADLISSAAASGAISSAQFNQIMAGHMSETDIENLILDSGNFGPAATAITTNRPPTAQQNSSAAAALIKAGSAAVQAAHPTANLGPGASPRVAMPAIGTSFLTQSTIVPGIPNIGLLAIGGGLLLAFAMRGK